MPVPPYKYNPLSASCNRHKIIQHTPIFRYLEPVGQAVNIMDAIPRKYALIMTGIEPCSLDFFIDRPGSIHIRVGASGASSSIL